MTFNLSMVVKDSQRSGRNDQHLNAPTFARTSQLAESTGVNENLQTFNAEDQSKE